MATGIEIAGLTLAAFPIVIDGLARFIEGVRLIKTWRTFRRELAGYQYGLRSARAFFQNTLEELLEGIATQEDIMTLQKGPDEVAMLGLDYELQLKVRLDHDYHNCLEAMTRILSAIEAIRRKLDLDATGKIMWDDYPTIKREVKRVKLVLSKKMYHELLDQIDKANQDLLQRTHQGRRLEPSRTKRRSNKRTVEVAIVRSRVQSLWNTLIKGKSWRCGCRHSHAASLRLEPRLWEKDTHEERIRFQLLLSRHPATPEMDPSWDNQVIEVLSSEISRPIEQAMTAMKIDQRPIIGKKSVSFSAPPTTPSSSATKPRSSPPSCATKHCIEDICTAIHLSSGTVRCLGMLQDDGKALHQHEVFLVENPKTKITRRSLQGLLEHPKQRVPGEGLSWRDSLNIAVTMASCMIQLDGTGWLKRQWDSEDIVFLTHEYTNPYLCWDIPSANVNPGTDVESSHPHSRQIRCPVLASLGITLIELCFGQSISNLRTAEDAAVNEAMTNWNTASRLVQYIEMERGERYGDVVRRCLECPFDVRDKSLENETFQKAVFDAIVLPLREELDNFMGVGFA
ncbi:hypothetical protein XPA_008408 [Xanthoria parietina]